MKEDVSEEILRRYYSVLCDYRQGICTEEVVERVRNLTEKVGLSVS